MERNISFIIMPIMFLALLSFLLHYALNSTWQWCLNMKVNVKICWLFKISWEAPWGVGEVFGLIIIYTLICKQWKFYQFIKLVFSLMQRISHPVNNVGFRCPGCALGKPYHTPNESRSQISTEALELLQNFTNILMEFGSLFSNFSLAGGFFHSAKLDFLNVLCASVVLYRAQFCPQ